jgi:FkbM family methyltransferase
MKYLKRHFLWHKHGITESWNHKGNRGKRLVSLFAGYYWFFYSKISNKPKDVKVFDKLIFRCYPGTSHAQSLFFNGSAFDDWDNMHFINKILCDGDRFLDIGANVGLHTLLAASKIGDNGYILSIEPISSNVKILKENVQLNSLSNVNILQIGISDLKGEYLFTADDVGSHMTDVEGTNTEKVSCLMLDDVLETDLEEFIITKIDVEGMELKIFKGAEKSFSKGLFPIIIFEFNGLQDRFSVDQKEIYDFFGKKAYIFGSYNHDLKTLCLDNALHKDTIAVEKSFVNEISSRYKDLVVTYL